MQSLTVQQPSVTGEIAYCSWVLLDTGFLTNKVEIINTRGHNIRLYDHYMKVLCNVKCKIYFIQKNVNRNTELNTACFISVSS